MARSSAHAVPLQTFAARQPVDQVLQGVDPRFEGVYAHVPFCFHKCHYCDFYSFVDKDDRQEAYVARLEQEVRAAAALVRAPLSTLFVGGGTPTLLQPPLLARMLEALRTTLPWRPDAEWTVEANPETVNAAVADALRSQGVNRVSLGAQSFHPHLLKALERWHDPASVARAVGVLRHAGVENFNLDLIFGIPGQTLEQWVGDLRATLALGPTHVSCYGLTYEPNTAMTARLARGEVARCPEDLEAAMYEAAQAHLAAHGLQQYEISNWCQPGRECQHNLLYWRNRDWLALGPSASGHAQGVRWKNVPRLTDWLEHAPWSPAVDVERVGPDSQVGERLMMGLRLREGIPQAEMERLLALGQRGAARRAVVEQHLAGGLLEWWPGDARTPGPALRFTQRGLLLADTVLKALI